MSARIEMVGLTFGRLLVLHALETRDNQGRLRYECSCACGKKKGYNGKNLRNGDTKSCGCLNREVQIAHTAAKCEDLTGRTFGTLIVIERSPNDKRNRPRYLCRCECGTVANMLAGNLKSGNTRGCGCTKLAAVVAGNQQANRRRRVAAGFDPNIPLSSENQRRRDEAAPVIQKVMHTDNYQCRVCGRNGNMNVHHIYPVNSHPDLIGDPDYMITLCSRRRGERKGATVYCHDKAHPRGSNSVDPEFQKVLLQIKACGKTSAAA